MRQKSRRVANRSKGNFDANVHFSDDLTTVLSRSGVSETDLSDLSIPTLDDIPDFDYGDFRGWNNDHNNNQNVTAMSIDPLITRNDHMNSEDCDVGTEPSLDVGSVLPRDEDRRSVNDMIGQLIAVSTRAIRATSDLERSKDSRSSLTVNSPAVKEAFEAANSLVRIINSVPPVKLAPPTSMQPTPPEDGEPPTADYGLIFMAFASHQYVLALFKAICDFVRRSIGSKDPIDEHDRQMLCRDEASSAQFVMVLQLVMHMINRIDRGLRLRNQNSVNIGAHDQTNGMINPHELTFGFGGEKGNRGLQGIVDAAQDMLRALPDEHVKLKQVIQGLQICIEERLHI